MRHNDSSGSDQHTRDAREIEKLRTQVALLQADLAVAKALLTAYAEDLEAALKLRQRIEMVCERYDATDTDVPQHALRAALAQP